MLLRHALGLSRAHLLRPSAGRRPTGCRALLPRPARPPQPRMCRPPISPAAANSMTWTWRSPRRSHSPARDGACGRGGAADRTRVAGSQEPGDAGGRGHRLRGHRAGRGEAPSRDPGAGNRLLGRGAGDRSPNAKRLRLAGRVAFFQATCLTGPRAGGHHRRQPALHPNRRDPHPAPKCGTTSRARRWTAVPDGLRVIARVLEQARGPRRRRNHPGDRSRSGRVLSAGRARCPAHRSPSPATSRA